MEPDLLILVRIGLVVPQSGMEEGIKKKYLADCGALPALTFPNQATADLNRSERVTIYFVADPRFEYRPSQSG